MFVEVSRLPFAHATVPLLHHLCVGNKSVECNVHCVGMHFGLQELSKGKHNASDRILSLQCVMNETIEIDGEDIGRESC